MHNRLCCIFVLGLWKGTKTIFPLSHARDKTKNIFVYFFTELKTQHLSHSIYKHEAINIANPSSMLKNFVIDLAHRRVSVAQWQSIGTRNWRSEVQFPMRTQNFFFYHTLVTRRESPLCISLPNSKLTIFLSLFTKQFFFLMHSVMLCTKAWGRVQNALKTLNLQGTFCSYSPDTLPYLQCYKWRLSAWRDCLVRLKFSPDTPFSEDRPTPTLPLEDKPRV